jgi:hypothetical protein
MRIERAGEGWVLVDGNPPSEARWRLSGGDVEVVSSSGRAYVVARDDVPTEVAVRLLALRDAQRYVASSSREPASAFALRTWLDTSRDPLLAARADQGGRVASWADYRFTLLAAALAASPGAARDGWRV